MLTKSMKGAPAVLVAVCATVATLLLAAGCGNSRPAPARGLPLPNPIALPGLLGGPASPSASASPTESGFPVNEPGITLTSRPQRIVSLSESATSMLTAMGAGEQIVAASLGTSPEDYQVCSDLHLSCSAPAVLPPANIDITRPSPSAIQTLQPDLVVIENDFSQIREELEALQINVYLEPIPKNINDSYTEMAELGKLTGNTDGAQAEIDAVRDQMKQNLANLKPGAGRHTYYFEIVATGPTYITATSKTFAGSLFSMALMSNIADSADPNGTYLGYPTVTSQFIVKAHPDAIFVADCCLQTTTDVASRPGWSGLSAVKGHHVVVIPPNVAYGWGPTAPALLAAIIEEANSFA